MVKSAPSASAARGSPVQILGADMAPLAKLCCGRRPTYKVEEDGHRCQLRASLPQQKEQILAADVSSGLIFLKNKTKQNKKHKRISKCNSVIIN